MIQEEYVTLETAKLLKEAGFDEKVSYCYVTQTHTTDFGAKLIERAILNNELIEYFKCKYYVPCPIQSLAARWLREAHNIYIILTPTLDGWLFDLFDLAKKQYILCNEVVDTDTYEQALEAGLQEALKIVISKNK